MAAGSEGKSEEAVDGEVHQTRQEIIVQTGVHQQATQQEPGIGASLPMEASQPRATAETEVQKYQSEPLGEAEASSQVRLNGRAKVRARKARTRAKANVVR